MWKKRGAPSGANCRHRTDHKIKGDVGLKDHENLNPKTVDYRVGGRSKLVRGATEEPQRVRHAAAQQQVPQQGEGGRYAVRKLRPLRWGQRRASQFRPLPPTGGRLW